MSWKIAYSVVIASVVLLGIAMLANGQEPLVTDVCLRCMCEAISGCNITKACSLDVCGIFRITYEYWIDGGKLTLDGESPDSQTAFPNCVNDPYCAAQTIQNYMLQFAQDCNGDNQIDCFDYAAIHKLGGNGCQGGIYGSYATKLNQCLQSLSDEYKDPRK